MAFVSIIVVAVLLYVLGRFLVKRLGWPTDLAGAGRWGMALLCAASLLGALPDLAQHYAAYVGPLPTVSMVEFVVGIVFLGLGVLGFVAWSWGAQAKPRDAEKLLPRRRAAPPPPAPPAEHDDFMPLGGHADAAQDDDT